MSDTTTESAQTTDAGATGAAPTGAATQAAQTEEAPKFTQDQFNAAIASEKRKWHDQQKAAADKARQEAEEAAAKEKGEYEKLANDRGTRLAQVETELAKLQEQYQFALDEIDRQTRARLRALPDEIRAMKPDGDALATYAWLEKAEAAAQKLAAQKTPGTPSGPRLGGGAAVYAPADAIAQKRASSDYNL